jgi:methyl-accepting chemotaxis protein
MTTGNKPETTPAAAPVANGNGRVAEENRLAEAVAASMQHLNGSREQVARIIKAVDEILFQTNVLALNAALEATRAGEGVMGFRVVADEVRALAQRCALAARETAGMVEEAAAKTNEGRTTLEHVTTAIREIAANAGAVKALVEEVNVGSQEQARRMEHIANAVTQMESVTESTAASAWQGAAAGAALSAQAETMQTIVRRLQQMVGV